MYRLCGWFLSRIEVDIFPVPRKFTCVILNAMASGMAGKLESVALS